MAESTEESQFSSILRSLQGVTVLTEPRVPRETMVAVLKEHTHLIRGLKHQLNEFIQEMRLVQEEVSENTRALSSLTNDSFQAKNDIIKLFKLSDTFRSDLDMMTGKLAQIDVLNHQMKEANQFSAELSSKLTDHLTEFNQFAENTNNSIKVIDKRCAETTFQLSVLKEYVDHFGDNLVLTSSQIRVEASAGFNVRPIPLLEVLKTCHELFDEEDQKIVDCTQKILNVEKELDQKAPESVVFDLNEVIKKVEKHDYILSKEEEQGVGALRKICDQLTDDVQQMSTVLADKVSRESVGLLLHEKYDDIVSYLQEALQSSQEDELNFKQKADDLQETLNKLAYSKVDRVEISGMQELMVKAEAKLKKLSAADNVKKTQDMYTKMEVENLLKNKIDRSEFESNLQLINKSLKKNKRLAGMMGGQMGGGGGGDNNNEIMDDLISTGGYGYGGGGGNGSLISGGSMSVGDVDSLKSRSRNQFQSSFPAGLVGSSLTLGGGGVGGGGNGSGGNNMGSVHDIGGGGGPGTGGVGDQTDPSGQEYFEGGGHPSYLGQQDQIGDDLQRNEEADNDPAVSDLLTRMNIDPNRVPAGSGREFASKNGQLRSNQQMIDGSSSSQSPGTFPNIARHGKSTLSNNGSTPSLGPFIKPQPISSSFPSGHPGQFKQASEGGRPGGVSNLHHPFPSDSSYLPLGGVSSPQYLMSASTGNLALQDGLSRPYTNSPPNGSSSMSLINLQLTEGDTTPSFMAPGPLPPPLAPGMFPTSGGGFASTKTGQVLKSQPLKAIGFSDSTVDLEGGGFLVKGNDGKLYYTDEQGSSNPGLAPLVTEKAPKTAGTSNKFVAKQQQQQQQRGGLPHGIGK